MFFRIRNFLSIVFSIVLLSLSGVAAATIEFEGELVLILEDDGTAEYSGVPVGTRYTGQIDDVTGVGSLSGGGTTTDFGCCIFAGSGAGNPVEISNDQFVDSASAAAINSILPNPLFTGGDMIDVINVEGDTLLPNGNRIEIGLSYIFDGSTFPDASLSNYPFAPTSPLLTLFFILEEDATFTTDLYSALGVVDVGVAPTPGPGPDPDPNVIPLPSSAVLILGGLLALIAVGRFRTSS